MVDVHRMNEEDLKEAIGNIEDKLNAIDAELTRLGSGRGLPTDRKAREELAQSQQKLSQKLKGEREELEQELTRRRENRV